MAEAQTPPRRNTTRTKTRSRSNAHKPCPLCGKKLRTDKGVEQHLADNHPEGV